MVNGEKYDFWNKLNFSISIHFSTKKFQLGFVLIHQDVYAPLIVLNLIAITVNQLTINN